MCTTRDIERIDAKIDKLFVLVERLLDDDRTLDVRLTRLEERWKAAAVVGTLALGLLALVAPVVHRWLGLGG